MAVLQKIRGWGIWLSLIIAVALLIFLLGDQSLLSWVFSRNVYVGNIGGDKIKYEEFNERLSAYQAVYGTSQKDNPYAVEDRVWASFMNEHMVIPAANEAGIYVTEDEVLKAMDDNIRLQSQGSLTLAEVLDYINSGSEDSASMRNSFNVQYEETLHQLYAQKYITLFNALDFDNSLVKKDLMGLYNTTATSVDMIVVPPTLAPSKEITVSEEEIKARYDQVKLHQAERSRDISYVVYHIAPSEDDIYQASVEFAEIDSLALADENLEKYIRRNSELKAAKYYRKGELAAVNRAFETAVFEEGQTHTAVEFDQYNHQYNSAFVLEEGEMTDTLKLNVYQLYADEAERVDSLMTDLRAGVDAETLADRYDVVAQPLTITRNNPGSFASAYDLPVNEYVSEESADNILVYAVTYKSQPELLKKVAVLRKTVSPSSVTENALYADAQRFYGLVKGGTQAFIDNAGQVGQGTYYTKDDVNDRTIQYEGLSYADPTFEGKSLTRTVFSNEEDKDLTPGKVSGIIRNGENFIIVTCRKEEPAGLPSLDRVRDQIENELRQIKTREALVAEAKAKIAGLTDMDAIAEALGTQVQNQEVNYSRYLNPYYGVATAQKFVGAVFAAKEGQIYGPIDGGESVFIFRVNEREPGAQYDESTISSLDQARRMGYLPQAIFQTMTEETEVENFVARYF
ncbi:MAG: peptidyl-prolyl cis-trans isomerase [Bacteroidales bacterium]|nr:peptidyl-prolyl cis-trans isomerase [Bacteroidales bacterium]